MPKADNVQAIKWLTEMIDNIVDRKLRQMGIPNLFMSGVVSVTRVTNGHTFADVYINGSSKLTTNIPVNPDIVANVATNTPVWVVAINFNNIDMFVLARKLA